MRTWLFVNVGIVALIVAGCATPPPVRQSAMGIRMASQRSPQPAAQPQITGRVMGCVALDYDRKTGEGSGLSTIGPVRLNTRGIIEGDKGKSGWVTINTSGSYVDEATGETIRLSIKRVSFWVNKGGKNWWEFEVEKVVLEKDPTVEVSFAAAIEQLSPEENRPVLTIKNKYRLFPAGANLNSTSFQQGK